MPSTLALRCVHLFAGCSDEVLQHIALLCNWRTVAAKTSLFSRESSGGEVYFLLNGRVRITSYSELGREVSFRDYEAGEHFGDLSAIDGQQRSADVIAIEDSLVVSISSAQFLALLDQNALIARHMMQHLTQLVRKLTDRVLELSNLDVPTRVQMELLRLAQAIEPDGSARIEPAPTHAALAGKISATREQVAREISALTKRGLIRKEGSRLLRICAVSDLEALVAMTKRQAV
ncbi:Crp/Fnr family transcriptional regulator [Lampropedia aestuarii]|uniref:Crp/Fnr family transcriptional regulator n=1 Tax=Lampropedia aestuarii TaxID=2562762 RepID=UPI002468FFC8|nr:Crp/Fnr family transcriptional regulator [Lampropedia aestuarii]MDH5857733.1 Crp/Fnr family transcriptional regulator [Lampropedia aestuarii]